MKLGTFQVSVVDQKDVELIVDATLAEGNPSSSNLTCIQAVLLLNLLKPPIRTCTGPGQLRNLINTAKEFKIM